MASNSTPTSSRASSFRLGFSPAAVMDPEGDVVLVVPTSDGRKARFQINSGTICVASPVFRAMLGKHSRFKEASALSATSGDTGAGPAEPYELNLEDDNPSALAVVLRIIHMKNDLVPKTLNEDQLYEVAILCDKYDLSQALVFWVDRCIPLLVPDESQQPPTVIGHKWLFISYVFRRKELFHALSQEIIFTATTSSTDESPALIIKANDGTGMNDYLPESILGEITARRQECYERLMDLIHQVVDKYSTPGWGALQCSDPKKVEACDSFTLGFLIRAFRLRGVYPVASPEVIHKSIRDLKSALDNIEFPSTLHYDRGPAPAQCSSCNRAVNNAGACTSCSRTNLGQLGPNHASSCSPVTNLLKNIQEICDKVKGLNLRTFVRSNKGAESDVLIAGEDEALWEYVAYEQATPE